MSRICLDGFEKAIYAGLGAPHTRDFIWFA
jgi:hypothetical protein